MKAHAMASMQEPIITVRGVKVALGPLRKDYLALFWPWFNDLEVMQTYSPKWSPMTWETLEQWYRQAVENPQTFAFTVHESKGMKPIGYSMLVNVKPFDRIADFDIIIGDKSYWGQGYGTEATRLTLDYGFTILGLHNIMLTVRSYNARGVNAYKRAGFQVIGRRREARRVNHQAHDLIYMDGIATDFQHSVLETLLSPRAES
jgi:RimJ/RimL family protein N-acetyltransferase